MLVQVAAGIRSLLCGITLYRAPAGCMPPRAAVEIGERSGVTNGSGARLDSTEQPVRAGGVKSGAFLRLVPAIVRSEVPAGTPSPCPPEAVIGSNQRG